MDFKSLRFTIFFVAWCFPPNYALANTVYDISISSPDFIIPLDGKSGTLDIFSDPLLSPITSGFDALGSQTFDAPSDPSGGVVSAGELILRMHFSGPPLNDPMATIGNATINFTVSDFDFLSDQVTSNIILREIAMIDAANGVPINPAINLQDYLPAAVSNTDDATIQLDPIDLIPPLSADAFTDPFILSFALRAELTNTGNAIRLRNTPESIIGDMHLSVTTIPEPDTLTLLGLGLLLLTITSRRSTPYLGKWRISQHR